MFTYLVSPEDKKKSMTLAINIQENTITLYKRKYKKFNSYDLDYIPIIGTKLKNWLQNYMVDPIDQPILKVEQSTPLISSELDQSYYMCLDHSHKTHHYKYIYDYYAEHNRLHTQEDESWIQHYHLQHDHDVTLKDLEIFLNEMKNCADESKFRNEVFISDAAKEKAIDTFKKFLQLNQHSQNRIYGNHPCYNEKDMPNGLPSIYQHSQCLFNSFSTGCLPPHPITPECKSSQKHTGNYNGELLGTLALGLFTVGFFTKKYFNQQEVALSKTTNMVPGSIKKRNNIKRKNKKRK